MSLTSEHGALSRSKSFAVALAIVLVLVAIPVGGRYILEKVEEVPVPEVQAYQVPELRLGLLIPEGMSKLDHSVVEATDSTFRQHRFFTHNEDRAVLLICTQDCTEAGVESLFSYCSARDSLLFGNEVLSTTKILNLGNKKVCKVIGLNEEWPGCTVIMYDFVDLQNYYTMYYVIAGESIDRPQNIEADKFLADNILFDKPTSNPLY